MSEWWIGKTTLSVVLLVLVSMLSLVCAGELRRYSGEQPPGFVLPDLTQQRHDVTSYRGSVIVVNFWASWCPPCIAELPSLVRLVERFEGRPFKLLAVNMSETAPQIRAFLERSGIRPNFPILLDRDASVLRSWRVYAFPTTYVLDAQGQVRYQLLGAAEWDSSEIVRQIDELMGSASVTASVQ